MWGVKPLVSRGSMFLSLIVLVMALYGLTLMMCRSVVFTSLITVSALGVLWTFLAFRIHLSAIAIAIDEL